MEGTAACGICLQQGGDPVRLSETDADDVRWSTKLAACVPEVHWSEHTLICGACRQRLDVACEFRELCLRSQRCAGVKDEAASDADEKFEIEVHDAKLEEPPGPEEEQRPPEFVCYHCNASYASKGSLISHINRHKAGGLKRRFACEKCGKVYASEGARRKHSDRCGRDGATVVAATAANKCEICGGVFSSKYLTRRHVRNVHAVEKKYECEVCEQKFASPVYLSAHKRYHSGERTHICPSCGKAYITASDLYHHEKIHANKRAYRCDKCPKAFNTSSDLHKHKICVHVDRSLWKYACGVCERRFPLKTNLDTHMKTHTGERNFACHMCERRCINRSVLKRHVESHSNVRSFRCTSCGQDYKHRKSLDVHMARAHGVGDAKVPERVKRYFCHVCPKAYFANNKLQKHIRSHTGERPFGCHVCEKRFIDSSYVRQHLKTAHNVDAFKTK